MSTTRVLLRSVRSTRTYSSLERSSFLKAPSIYTLNNTRHFSSSSHLKMPEPLKHSEVNSQTDPSVAKQYDQETPKEQQIKDLFNMIDGKKISMLNTYRNGVGPVGRSMAVAKRIGPDLLFLANGHSKKISDLSQNKECQVIFQDSKTQDWISLSGTATTVSNTDARIKDVWSSPIRAWFGDLGDGKHDGSPDDPRMTLIEFKPKYAVYYLTQVGLLGYMKEVGVAAVTGKIADTGVIRELDEKDLETARGMKEQRAKI